MQSEKELIPHLFRTEYSKITAVLARLFGFAYIETAEDIVSDTFMLAAETWGQKGLPENPTAWLYAVAKNRAKDYLRRDTLYNEKIALELKRNAAQLHEIEIDLSGKNINDSLLQMMFAICQPCIPAEAQIGLALRVLCGFGITEIADAFLSNKETITKRLFRAKEKLRQAKVKIEFPAAGDIESRLSNVLTTLYLLFNEGYHSPSQNISLRKDLCLEAMRLNLLLVENPATNKPATNALMALMCFHASRFDARTDSLGEPVLYQDQDAGLWNKELILRGQYYLSTASRGNELSKYHLEAAIAHWHTSKTDLLDKWEHVLQLYNTLLLIEYSPVTALNRTYALARANGKPIAIVEAEKLNLQGNSLYFSLLGYLYTDIDTSKAIHNYQTALKLTRSAAERSVIKRALERLG